MPLREGLSLELFQRMRHDLLNDLQILSGHIQLDRSKATLLGDVEIMVERIQSVARFFACGNSELATVLWQWEQLAYDGQITVSYEIERLERPQYVNVLPLEELTMPLFNDLALLPEEARWMHIAIKPAEMTFSLRLEQLLDQGQIVNWVNKWGVRVVRLGDEVSLELDLVGQ